MCRAASILAPGSPHERRQPRRHNMIRRHAIALFAVASMIFSSSSALGQSKAAPAPPAAAAQTVKIAFVDPLSGPFAGVGTNILRHFQFMTEFINAQQLAGPGIRLQFGSFDNKGTPQEATTVLKERV